MNIFKNSPLIIERSVETMKIEYIKLKNYANFYTIFKSREVSIDLRTSKNRIILIAGPNGSGKTSLLSCLHPFATNGTLDIRNDNSLILENEEGYKEIWFNDDGNRYVIKHFYTPSKTGHTVKSYIERNGMELNPNGNVTSFKEKISEELGIEMDYLKLIRLGSNVTNFIKLKTTERKSFMGKLLEEVDIYLKYYKKMVNDMRQIKSIISHTVDKISKLSILDKDELIKNQKYLKSQIDTLSDKVNDLNNDLSIIDYNISSHNPLLVIKEDLDNKRKVVKKINKILDNQSGDISLSDCDLKIKEINDGIIKTEASINNNKDKLADKLDLLDNLIKEKNEIIDELRKIENSEDIKNMKYMISELKDTIEKRASESKIIDYKYNFTKKEMEDLIVSLDMDMEILYTTYEFGKEPIKKAIQYIRDNRDISDYVVSHKEKETKNKLQLAAELLYKHLVHKFGNIKPLCKNFNSCDVMNFYDEVYELATCEPDTVKEDEVFVSYTKMAFQNINTVLKNICTFKALFEKMPDEIKNTFILDNILKKIENLECIYDKELFYSELSLCTEYELQQNDLNNLSELKDKLKLLKKSIGNSSYFESKLLDLEESIDDIDTDIDELNKGITQEKDYLKRSQDNLDFYNDLKVSLENKNIEEEKLNSLENEYQTVSSLCVEKREKNIILDNLKYELNKTQKEYNDNDYRLKSYKTLNSELNEYRKKYDEMELIKDSLSSKKGIPLLFIQVYLKNIQETTNQLLDTAYNGDLYITDFDINADEFKIPYNTKGTQIKDICYASQGEESFISLSLSFALIYQSLSRYNIMLLDEIDSTLDTKKRERFLQILEKMMDMIDSEQLFVISHNNMFNSYPVDVINTINDDMNMHLSNKIIIDVK